MRKKKTWIWGLAAAGVLAIAVSACGSENVFDEQDEVSADDEEKEQELEEQGSEENEQEEQEPEEPESTDQDNAPEITTDVEAARYIDICLGNVPDYKKLIRYEENYVGVDYALNVEVAQVMEDGTLRVYDDENFDGYYSENEYVIMDERTLDHTKIIQGDVISVYGRYAGMIKMTRALGNTVESVPGIHMYVCVIGGVNDTEYENPPEANGFENLWDTEYILPDSDSRYLNESDLAGLSKEELRIARNEIFARHGRRFNDKGLQSYFESCSWYDGYLMPDEFDESVLNEYERANMEFIKKYE